jgi:hypothetical protein
MEEYLRVSELSERIKYSKFATVCKVTSAVGEHPLWSQFGGCMA